MKDTRAINQFLLSHGLRIRSNPAISPDLCLEPGSLVGAARAEEPQLAREVRTAAGDRAHAGARVAVGGLDLHPASELEAGGWRLFAVEDRATGDAGLIADGSAALPVPGTVPLGGKLQLAPLRWAALPAIKNLLQTHDPDTTVSRWRGERSPDRAWGSGPASRPSTGPPSPGS